jgi:hypothetical protein
VLDQRDDLNSGGYMQSKQGTFSNFMAKLNGPWHQKALWVTVAIVFGHLAEHLTQVYQVYAMGWLPKEAGGILGLWYPWLAQSEVLHIAYNSSMWIGLFLLRPGVTGKARKWWNVALVLQTWHFFEHLLLQYQYISGNNFFGASERMGFGQLLLPRVELHFIYNLVVFIPFVVAYFIYLYRTQDTPSATPQSAKF